MKRWRKVRQLFFSYRGRISRPMWWCCRVVWFIYIAVPSALFAGLEGIAFSPVVEAVGTIVGMLWICPWVWASIALDVKRLHDNNLTGWLLLLGLIPLFGAVFGLCFLACYRGDSGRNKYGPPPLDSVEDCLEYLIN